MALTKSFKTTIQERVQNDKKFRRALLTEAMESFSSGDVDTSKALMKDYINAAHGVQKVADLIEVDPKSLHRMLGPKGNPTIQKFSTLISVLSKLEKVNLSISAKSR